MKIKHRKAKIETWKKRLNVLKKAMKLSDWDISIKYADLSKYNKNDDTIARVEDIYVIEKKAKISIHNKYYEVDGYCYGWNIDTVIIHELTHVILEQEIVNMPKKVVNHKSFERFEEFICDVFSDLLYSARARKSLPSNDL